MTSNRFFILFLFLILLSSIPLAAQKKHTGGLKKIKITLLSVEKYYCVNKPLEVKVVFENVTNDDVLVVDPRTCESCFYFDIKNSKGEKVKPEVGETIYQIHETNIKLTILKAGSRIELKKDVTKQYFGLNKYSLQNEGYYISATFRPRYRFVTEDGKKAYYEEIPTNEIEVLLRKCQK